MGIFGRLNVGKAEKRYKEQKRQAAKDATNTVKNKRSELKRILKSALDNAISVNLDERAEALCRSRDKKAVENYCTQVLRQDRLLPDIPESFILNYYPETAELALHHELPGLQLVPDFRDAKYDPGTDTIEYKPIDLDDHKAEYFNAISEIVLRRIHRLMTADQALCLSSIAFSGYMDEIDSDETVQDIGPCIFWVRITRVDYEHLRLQERHEDLSLKNFQPAACIRRFNPVSKLSSAGFLPITPPIPNQTEGVGSLTDLQKMTPSDVEHLVRRLLEREGCGAEVTPKTRDGGIDIIAKNNDPINGGTFLVQVKRWQDKVGEPMIRDLLGTVYANRATKGIMVTTGLFSDDAEKFAKNNEGQITLINGPELFRRLAKNGITVRTQLKGKVCRSCNGDLSIEAQLCKCGAPYEL